ncbi:MAG TPA: hypothetical protein VG940_07310, partial [Gemmatimonadales bacterium]|nr:hypothetical protein [Gemmatimonadales bacterium]
MTTRTVFTAVASLLLTIACDGGMTGPSYLHLTSLAPSAYFSCGLDAEGRAYCWGSDNSRGQLGDGTNAASDAPVRVRTGARFTAIAAGAAHACGLDANGRTFCWGDNAEHQVGTTTTDLDCNLRQPNGWMQDFGNACAVVPAPVETALRFVKIAAAEYRTCGLTSGGEIWCWGAGVLGDSAGTSESSTPVRVSSAARFQEMGLGPYHTCASGSDGMGYCWGSNNDGSLGGGTADSLVGARLVPHAINSAAFIRRWALGREHTCALTGSGQALCWGRGDAGQRGDSTTVPVRNEPTYVATTLRFGRIAAAANATCARQQRIQGGHRRHGGVVPPHRHPVVRGEEQLAAGDNHVCGRTATG